jgi:hypothetical protein
MTTPWPNSTYEDGQVSPDPLAFFDPPRRADVIRAHQMVAQSYFAFACLMVGNCLVKIPGIVQDVIGRGTEANLGHYVNVFIALCFIAGIGAYILFFRLAWNSVFSLNAVAAHKISFDPPPKGRKLLLRIALFSPLLLVFGWLLFGSIWAVHTGELPRAAGALMEMTAFLGMACVFVSIGFQRQKGAVEGAISDGTEL